MEQIKKFTRKQFFQDIERIDQSPCINIDGEKRRTLLSAMKAQVNAGKIGEFNRFLLLRLPIVLVFCALFFFSYWGTSISLLLFMVCFSSFFIFYQNSYPYFLARKKSARLVLGELFDEENAIKGAIEKQERIRSYLDKEKTVREIKTWIIDAKDISQELLEHMSDSDIKNLWSTIRLCENGRCGAKISELNILLMKIKTESAFLRDVRDWK